METPVDGWDAPVYQGLLEPHLFCGVSSTLMIGLITVGSISLFWWWPLVLLAAAVWGVARIGTHYDARFFEIVREHWRQAPHYEG